MLAARPGRVLRGPAGLSDECADVGGITAEQEVQVVREGERVWFLDQVGKRQRVLAWQSFPYVLLPSASRA
jgi:hypothetical protein